VAVGDSVAVGESVAVGDSVAVGESVAVGDSVAVGESVAVGDWADGDVETVAGVADWETAPPVGEGWDGGELSGPLWVGCGVCETRKSPMTLGTRRAAAASAASSPVASNAHARPRRFLRGGWPSA
jgi:pyruvate/2-oxoglutarate dehydrogenase complex dihydrolipoamide acyltransferase (E2) component